MTLDAIEAQIMARIEAVSSGHFAESPALAGVVRNQGAGRVFRKLPGAYVAFLGGRADPDVSHGGCVRSLRRLRRGDGFLRAVSATPSRLAPTG